jgi:hypothetical protein
MDWIHVAHGPVAGSCEHGNEPLGYIKGKEFLDHQSDYFSFS